MVWTKEYLDVVLVPSGLLFLGIYHLYLIYRIIIYPDLTVIGYENGIRKIWVHKMMQEIPRNTKDALQVISSNISASTFMAGLSITLSSLIGTIVGSSTTSSQSKLLANHIIYGDRSSSTSSVKYATLLICFLIAFISQVQCIRYYVQVNFLISTPGSSVPAHYVEHAVIRGSNFWSLGVRAYYFAFPLLLWVFGPIPMFSCCLGMVCFLYFIDTKDNPISPFGSKEEQKRVIQKSVLQNEPKHTIKEGPVIESHPKLGSQMRREIESPQQV
ncbi:uncharacterized protein LOC131048049 [Cryptomeria japonica]|uniref:uncharacterized protein LOC131048049 n=1 Tax=Cryptomeria japonica TaxID=3369 RepID=UPI0027D9F1BD|nr:uncharacterized protein LOC131048049 [Cryptomeria japonica]